MRVLIVEDEVRLASTLQDLLELNGYTADASHDGESGLDNALSGIYDVVLLDVMLPKQDGFTVLRRLRAAGNATPVLMLTARSELGDRVEGLDCGRGCGGRRTCPPGSGPPPPHSPAVRCPRRGCRWR